VSWPSLGPVIGAAVVILLIANVLAVGNPALADLLIATPAPAMSEFRVLSPAEGATVGDGDLVMVEGIAVDRSDGAVDRVEVAVDDETSWQPAQFDASDRTRWSFLWQGAQAGGHQVHARVFGLETRPLEVSVNVNVTDAVSGPYVIDNPYAASGRYFKGEIHVHSTSSFDGWNSYPPAQLALTYKSFGYNWMIITDHDVISYPKEVNDDSFITIPGYESTADSGHITGAFVQDLVPNTLSAQQRIDGILRGGGMAFVNHPSWTIGWNGTDLQRLNGYSGIEIYNKMTGDTPARVQQNLALWHQALNAKGWPNHVYGIAVDDAHMPADMNYAWVEAKAPALSQDAIRRSLESGSFYFSNGPSFDVLGVMNGAISASSADASSIRFIDQDMKVVGESKGGGATYRPMGVERFVRVEAVMADGRTAWSQPFWLTPNAPKAALAPTFAGAAVVGETLPRARIDVADNGEYLGNTTASDDGVFVFRRNSLAHGPHNLWVQATAPWPDQVTSAPTLLTYIETPSS
jgi:hypothetical protein